MRTLARLIHPPALGAGMLVTLAVSVPVALFAQILDDAGSVDDDSPWLFALFVVILASMIVGGYVAAMRSADAPLVNGAMAALAAYLLVQVIGAIRLIAIDGSVEWAAIPFFALLAASAGMSGGLIADHRARTPARSSETSGSTMAAGSPGDPSTEP